MEIKNKYLPFLLAFSAITVETCAAFFSVYGLTKLFSGAILAVAIMASSLEIAKVVSATYLYRQWVRMNKIFKVYFTGAVFILMIITSLGIYGFLNNAFQTSTIGIEKETTKLGLYQDEIKRLEEQNTSFKSDKATYQKALDDELAGLVVKEESRYYDANKRRDAINRYQPFINEKDSLISINNSKISSLTDSVSALKVQMIDTGVDVGPIIFVARALGMDVSSVVQYLIILFIIVFDPLALALVVAFNQMIIQKYKGETENFEIPTIFSKAEPTTDSNKDGLKWQGQQHHSTVITQPPPEPIKEVLIPPATSAPSPETESADVPEIASEPKEEQKKEDKKAIPQPIQTTSF